MALPSRSGRARILHRSPRTFGHARSAWTPAPLAEVARAEGLGPCAPSVEAVRQALPRLEVGWRRAERRLASPDPAYAQENAAATGG